MYDELVNLFGDLLSKVLDKPPIACKGLFRYAIKDYKRKNENEGTHELELELIQTHMTQKPLLWVEVGARAVRERSKRGGGCGQSANVAWRLCGCVLSVKPVMAVWCRQLSLCGAPPRGFCAKHR